jgi:acyl-CoA reductase-like NAD-dependent aldehyde dehydrogenase
VNNEAQWRRVNELLADAVAAGGQLIGGGKLSRREGGFVEPTIIVDAVGGMHLVDEEQFWPLLPVIAYDDLDAAVEHVNSGEFGLGASVWGAEAGELADVAERIDAGTVWTNSHGRAPTHIPFGGSRASGIGLENARSAWRGIPSSGSCTTPRR